MVRVLPNQRRSGATRPVAPVISALPARSRRARSPSTTTPCLSRLTLPPVYSFRRLIVALSRSEPPDRFALRPGTRSGFADDAPREKAGRRGPAFFLAIFAAAARAADRCLPTSPCRTTRSGSLLAGWYLSTSLDDDAAGRGSR